MVGEASGTGGQDHESCGENRADRGVAQRAGTAFAWAEGLWQSLARRARIVLLAADGKSNLNIADILAVTPLTVSKWRKRFAGQGLDGLHDEPRKLSDDAVAAVVRKTLEETPRDATHWSLRLHG